MENTMKKLIITAAVIAGLITIGNTANANNWKNTVAGKQLATVNQLDKRIRSAYIEEFSYGNTIILKGVWPGSYYTKRWDGVRVAKVVASDWCLHFYRDPAVTNVIIRDMRGQILGNAYCK